MVGRLIRVANVVDAPPTSQHRVVIERVSEAEPRRDFVPLVRLRRSERWEVDVFAELVEREIPPNTEVQRQPRSGVPVVLEPERRVMSRALDRVVIARHAL